MKALILAAGYATRMYPLTQTQPKSLLPIGKRVVIDWTMHDVSAVTAINEIFLVSNAKFAEQFARWIAQRTVTTPVTLVNDGSTDDHVRLGSVRDMQLVIQQHQVHDPLLISAGDHIAEWDLDAFIRFGQSRAPHASVALYRLPDPALACKFGIAHIDAKQQIISFAEKPAHTTSDLAAVCVYYFPPEIFPRLGQYLGTGENADAPGYFVRWLSRQEPVYGWPAEGRLFDIGSIEAYTEAQREFEGAAT